MIMKKYSKILVILCLLSLCSCGSEPEKTQPKTRVVVAKSTQHSTHLFYEGHLVPLSPVLVVSELNAKVESMWVHYGEFVHKDQVLLSLSSVQLAQEFRTALTQYVQRKNSYELTRENLQSTLDLQKAGVVSQEEYQTA